MNTLNVFPKTYRSISVLGLILSIFSNAIGNDQGGFGTHITYSMPHNLIGVSITSIRVSGFGFYYEFKAGIENPSVSQNRETFLNISGGFITRMKPNLFIFFGGGASWRIYSVPPGYIQQGIEDARLNLIGGIILMRKETSIFPGRFFRSRLSYQIGVDTQPFGVNIGFGLHFNLPFLKRSG